MPLRKDTLPHEWRTLRFAPFWIFLAVAGSDGNIDQVEFQALIDLIGQYADGEASQDAFVKELFASVQEDFDNLVVDFDRDDRDLRQGLADINQVFETRLTDDEAQALGKTLLKLGYEIAEAEGNLRLGSKTSEVEKEALEFIVEALVRSPDELTALLSQKRRRNIFGSLRSLLRITWPVTAFAFLVMGISSFFLWVGSEVGSPKENLSLLLGLVSCVSFPVVLLYGLFFRESILFSRKTNRRVLILIMLCLPICFCCGALWLSILSFGI